MKRFSRCVLILILVAIVSGAAGYVYENKKITPMYESTTQLYVVPGEENEASIRASNGGLKEDFTIIFKSNVVISAAQRIAGTSEDIAQYLTITSPANSNIVEIKCTNPDQNTAKKYVDAVASTAIKTTSIIPVKSIQILSDGTSSGVAFKPDLYKKTLIIAGAASAICAFIEIVVCLFISAFKSKEADFNHEYEYERRFGHVDYIDDRPQLIEAAKDKAEHAVYDSQISDKKEHTQAKAQSGIQGLRNIADTVEEEEDILEKLEHEVSDYFNDDNDNKQENGTGRRRHIRKSEDHYAEVNSDDDSDSVNMTDNETEDMKQPKENESENEAEVQAKVLSEDTTAEDTASKDTALENTTLDDTASKDTTSNDTTSKDTYSEATYSEAVITDEDISEDKEFTEGTGKEAVINESLQADAGVSEDSLKDEDMASGDISVVDKLSDEELKNIEEMEDQAAAAVDDEEPVEKVLREAEQVLSSGVSEIQTQEAVVKNYRVIGTIKR